MWGGAGRLSVLLAVSVMSASLAVVPTFAARPVSPVGDQPVFSEKQLLDELPPLQAQRDAPGGGVVVPFTYELEPGERNPTGIEVAGVARGGAVPQPIARRNGRLTTVSGFGQVSLRFKPSRDPFFAYVCTPSSAYSVGCEEAPVYVPTAAGRYYWHLRPARDGPCPGLIDTCLHDWDAQVATFTIPSAFRLNGLAVPARTRSCVTGGVIRYESNEPSPVADYSLAIVPAGSRTPVLRLADQTGSKMGVVEVKRGEYQHTVRVPLDRVRSGRYYARVRLSDAAGHRARARSRTFFVPNPSATCRAPRFRGSGR
jgi:hypothetical protein